MFNSEFPPVEEPAKPQRKKWPWIVGGVVGGLVLIGVLASGKEPAQAEPVVTTVTATVTPTPTTTTSAPPTTTLPPTTTAEPEPVILEEEDAYVAPAPLVMQPDVDTPPVRQAVPEPVVQAPPPPPPPAAPEPAPRSANYANCSEVRAAGAAPIYRGEPGYSSKLDRDGDGVACE